MRPRHPFERVPPGYLRRWFAPLAAGALVTGTVLLSVLDSERGLLMLFELMTASAAEARRLVEAWTPADRARIAFAGGFDFLFGLLWTSTFAAACVWAARVFRRGALAALGGPLAWTAWLVCLLDAPENGAYVLAVLGAAADPWQTLGAAALAARIALFLVLCAYLSLAGVARLAGRATARTSRT